MVIGSGCEPSSIFLRLPLEASDISAQLLRLLQAQGRGEAFGKKRTSWAMAAMGIRAGADPDDMLFFCFCHMIYV